MAREKIPTPIELLIEVRDALPVGHHEKPGLIRAVELLRSFERASTATGDHHTDRHPGPTSITCPRCQMTSHSPGDIRHGYCGNCHDYTSPPAR